MKGESARFQQGLKEKRESNAALQRQRALPQEERSRKAIDVMTKHTLEFAHKNGQALPSESEARAGIQKIADTVENKRSHGRI